jgi:hypothetical protein
MNDRLPVGLRNWVNGERPVRRFLCVLVIAMIASPCVAQVQPGSTGGSIGKTEKSISGGDQAPAPAPTPRQATSRRSAAPASPAAPHYLGCFRDQQANWWTGANTQGRDLNGLMTNDAGMTSARCISVCRSQGFTYAGTQYATYCFCGNAYGRSGAATCDTPCAGNHEEMCGGGWANSVYRVSP